MTEPRRQRIVYMTSCHRVDDVRIFRKQCVTLAKRGYDVHLVVPHDRSLVREGVQVVAVPKPRNRWQRFTRTAGLVYQTARQLNADLYVLHDPDLLRYGAKLAREGKRVVFDAHENYVRQIRRKPWIPRPFRRIAAGLYRASERVWLRRFAGVLTASAQIAQSYAALGKPVAVVQNFSLPAHAPVLGIQRYAKCQLVDFGGVGVRSSITHLVEALGRLPETSQWNLILGGRTENAETLSRLKTMPGWQRVTWLGMASYEEVQKYLLESSLCPLLYTDVPNNNDIRSNRLFESLAAGLPVLVSNLPAWQRFIETHACGTAVNAKDTHEIVDTLVDLEKDPQQLAAWGQTADQLARAQFSWQSQVEGFLAFMDQVIGIPSNQGPSPARGNAPRESRNRPQ